MTNDPFVLERTFKAPRALVWDTMHRPEHLRVWMASPGMTPGRVTVDFRPGGIYHYELIGEDGTTFWGRWLYRDIIDQELIVNHVSFSDEGCGITRHPMAPDWPLETLSRITLTEVKGGTKVRVEWSPLGSDPTQLSTFANGRPGMTQGWNGTMDKLEAHLEAWQNA